MPEGEGVRGQIHIILLPEHPIMSSKTIEIKMTTVLVNESIGEGTGKTVIHTGILFNF